MLNKKDNQKLYPVDPTVPPGSIGILNGRVIDPVNGTDDRLCVAVDKGTIVSIAPELPSGFTPDTTIDAAGKWVVPGLMDMHVHLREPGREDRETIETGTRAASAGGFTAVACMPNTNPVLDEESKIRYVVQRGEPCTCRIYPIGSITKGLEGKELSPFGEMVRAGARGVSDDGKSVISSMLMKNALNYSKSFDIPVICHCEDSDLTKGAHMNESAVSTRLGMRGIPSISEEIMVARDIMLAEYTGARIHIAHVSTAGSVRIIREAKARGVNITCETCPHYFTLIDEDLIPAFDTYKKMNPPLRTAHDRDVLLEGIADGTIDIIASDHAPHVSEDKKDVEFEAASFGVIGLETSLGVVLTYLIGKKVIDPHRLVERMSCVPNRILGLSGGTLSRGADADITVIDPDARWKVDPNCMYSKSRNTAFDGFELQGYASCTISQGRIVYERGAA
ncbi:MAG: amidohydrolase family protein [Chitinivibrionales bacterium]|nr:amidohydrolase family protein [Chitinivibrionales bacterium]